MPSDYKAITKYNEEQLGKDTASRKSQVNMYSDFSHFIFELLQNADDHKATRVTFNLFPKKLIVEHNGIPFAEKNIKAISYFGKSTSRDDLVKTGCFGLGFKSVFAITATPSIYSGDENFMIYDLYRLKALLPPNNIKPEVTRICLPFNHYSVKPNFVETIVEEKIAFEKISHRLKKLDINTLLFTTNILEIIWNIKDKHGNKTIGHYLRDDKKELKLKINKQLQKRRTEITDGNSLNTYLVYSRPIKWQGKEYKPVDIAFFLHKENEKEKIIPCPFQRSLSVLFPTTVDTHMGFLINGPFRTPAHRETVSQEDMFNQFLFEETANLLIDTLIELRKKGFLTVSLLETLPIEMQYFPEENMFYPIANRVRKALLVQELLPADNDSEFVSAKNAKLASDDKLRKLLTYNQLKELHQHRNGIKWLSATIKKNSKLYTYIMEELNVDEIDAEQFVKLITDEFIDMQTDDWLIKFYNFLKIKSNIWKKSDSILRQIKFLRLEDNTHVLPFENDGTPNAYLPSSVETNFPTIKRNIYNNEGAADFLKRLGIIEPDLFAEIIEFILPKYTKDSNIVDFIDNIDDIKKIKNVLDEQKHSSLALAKSKILLGKLGLSEIGDKLIDSEKINPTLFMPPVLNSIRLLRAFNGEKNQYRSPLEMYYNTSDLQLYFQRNFDAWFLNEDYPDEFMPFFQKLGIHKEIKVTKKGPDKNGFVIINNSHSFHRRGLNGFDPDIKVEGIENAILTISIEKSKFIWNNIAIPHSDCIRGVVESSSRKTYENSSTKDKVSEFGFLLIDSEWLPDTNGNWHKPGELKLDELPDSFIKDEKLAKQLRMKEDISEQILTIAGISQNTLKLAQELEKQPQEIQKQIISLLQKNRIKPAFPSKKSANPGRREKKILERQKLVGNKTYEKKERSVKTSKPTHDPKEWLMGQYTNDDEIMICQMCKNEMPFKLKDGSYYFEAVQIDDNFEKEWHELYLALCPLCAAKYRCFVKNDQNMMNTFLKNIIETNQNSPVPIELGENGLHDISFIETHLNDIKTILVAHYNSNNG